MVLLVLAGLSDRRKDLLAFLPGHRKSTESWSEVLRALKTRGLKAPKLVIGDGHLEIWTGLHSVYPEAKEQWCWNHRICNALDKVLKKLQIHAVSRVLRQWCINVMRSKVEPMKEVARLIRNHFQRIAAWTRTWQTNGFLEALNGLFQAAKRKARGMGGLKRFVRSSSCSSENSTSPGSIPMWSYPHEIQESPNFCIFTGWRSQTSKKQGSSENRVGMAGAGTDFAEGARTHRVSAACDLDCSAD